MSAVLRRAVSTKIAVATGPSSIPPRRIPVKEPLRVKRSPLPASAFRPTAVHGVRARGVRVAGPPMLRPLELDRAMAAARREALQHRSTQSNAPLTAPPSRAMPVPAPAGTRPGTRRAMSLPSDPTASGAGINPWWRYQEQSVPGDGRLMVNVGTGNLLLQDDDMSVPHKGLAMAFRRTYNSQSPNTVTGDLQTWTGLYGNGWTNTFDAHVIRTSPGHFSVYDIDGTRYDFVPSGTPGLVVGPPGQPTTLQWDGACGLLWQKKSGTLYYFYGVDPTQSCSMSPSGTIGGYAGRIYQIIGRNRNTYITFNYSWDNGNASVSGKISGITAATESGMTATLAFGDVNGHRLLQQLTYPDGTTSISYAYDSNGNLVNVTRPANNSSGTQPVQGYGYQALGSGYVLQFTASPRWNRTCATVGCNVDGAVFVFYYTGSDVSTATLNTIEHRTLANPTVPDGSNSTVLQPGYSTSVIDSLWEYYTTGVTTPTYRDTDGHMTNWVVDGLGRPTQTQECTQSTNQGQTCVDWTRALVTNESWDANNNRIADVDPRGNETDYGYDANGNTVAVGEPLTATSQGTFKPTTLYDYDSYNNVTAYCDQTETHNAGVVWSSSLSGSDTLCSTNDTSGQHWRASRTFPSYEPYGELSSMTTPRGYTRRFGYYTAYEGGTDYGLPTSVTGDSFAQADGSSLTPAETYWYDMSGNVRCYSNGVGISVLSYDALGRLTSVADPDDTSANVGSACVKSAGQAGWNTQTTYTYFPDGSLATQQAPSQRAVSTATQYAYDLDGNRVSQSHAFTCTSAPCTSTVTTSYYDGADRLVEVVEPNGPSDLWSSTPWMTRYIYDLTQGGSQSIAGVGFQAYGNLAQIEEYLPVDRSTPPWSWKATKATAFDAIDRVAAAYAFSPGVSTPFTTSYAYDANGQFGLLTSKTDALSESALMTYDNIGRVAAVQYQNAVNPTYARQFTFDADGRPATEMSGLFGTRTNTYDSDGNLTGRSIPAYGPIPSTILSYDYYPNGTKRDVAASLAPLSQSTPLLSWSYRPDGRRSSTIAAFAGKSYTMNEAYTDGGRLQSSSDVFGTSTRTYNSGGQLSTLAMPGGAFTQITHDAEDMVSSYVGFQDYFPPSGTTVSVGSSVRGEVLGEFYNPDFGQPYIPLSSAGTQSANGYLDAGPPGGPGNYGSDVWDVRTKMPISAWDAGGNNGASYSYDAIGRLTSSNDGWSQVNGNGEEIDRTGSYTKSYDAENRLVGMTASTYNFNGSKYCPGQYNALGNNMATTSGTFAYSWNVDNHPWVVDGYGVIWSDDEPLIVLNGSGSVASIHVDNRAILQAGYAEPILVLDRDLSGAVVSYHDSTGNAGMQPVSAYLSQCQSSGVSPAAPGATTSRSLSEPIYEPRLDGIWDGGNTIQGVRNYDASIGQWTTRDAYEGDVSDPFSEQAYMWNRNNPYSYSDPSGYCSTRPGTTDHTLGLKVIACVTARNTLSVTDMLYIILGSVYTAQKPPYVGRSQAYVQRSRYWARTGRITQEIPGTRNLSKYDSWCLEGFLICKYWGRIVNKIPGVSLARPGGAERMLNGARIYEQIGSPELFPQAVEPPVSVVEPEPMVDIPFELIP